MHPFITSSLIALVMATPGAKSREEVKDRVVAKFPRAAIGAGTLKSLDGVNLMIDQDGKTYTVQTGTFDKCTTKIVRRFGGESSLSELTIGDQIGVVGRFTDDTKTTVQACVVRDESIQKRFGTFVGDVKSVTPTGFVMTTVSESRADQTVTISTTTKLVNRRGTVVTQSDIVVGHRILVRGLWNRVNNTVTEVSVVRDYSLPVKPAVTASPTSSQ